MENEKTINLEIIKELNHGENIYQDAAIYKSENMIDYEILSDNELSYNDILDIESAVNIVSEFYDVNCTAIVRHRKPCGVALGSNLYESYTKAFDCDPIGSYYGVVAFSKPVDEEIAKHLNSMAVQAIAAPSFDENALKVFEENPNIKLVKLNTTLKEYRKIKTDEIHISPFGVLVQESNKSELNKDTFKVVTTTKPTAEQIEDAVFAWKVAKYAKTNAVVIAKDFKTSAIAQGYTNELAALEKALDYACDNSKDAILASDTVLSSIDCIHSAIQGRIALIIQPGDTLRDKKLIETCNKYGIAMITTGISNYRQ